jgi:hypothetical protein
VSVSIRGIVAYFHSFYCMKQPGNKKIKKNISEMRKRSVNQIIFMFLPGRHLTLVVEQTGG